MQEFGRTYRVHPLFERERYSGGVPLHPVALAPAGEKFGRFDGEDVYTTAESERLVRLPMYYGLTEDDQNKVIAKVLEFYEK